MFSVSEAVEEEIRRVASVPPKYCVSDEAAPCETNEQQAATKTAERSDRFFVIMIVVLHLVVMLTPVLNYLVLADARLVRNTDSWGNRCGVDNGPGDPRSSPLSGMDHSERGHVLLLANGDVRNVVEFRQHDQFYVRLCVSECPRTVLSCEQVLEGNGYGSIDAGVRDRRACIGPQKLVMPHKTGYVTCIPWLLPLTSSNSSRTAKDKHKEHFAISEASTSVIKEITGLWHSLLPISLLSGAALVLAYALTLMLFKYPHFSPYYCGFLALHCCVLSASICWWRIYKRQWRGGNVSDDLATALGSLYLRDIKYQMRGDEPFYASALDIDVTFYEDLLGENQVRDVGLVFQLYFIGTALIVALVPILFGASSLLDVYLNPTVVLFRACSALLRRAPATFLLPLITVWVVPAYFAYSLHLLYLTLVPRGSYRDEDGLTIITQDRFPMQLSLQILLIFLVALLIHFNRCAEKFLLAACICDAYFRPDGERLRVRSLLSTLFSSLGQIWFGAYEILLRWPYRLLAPCCSARGGSGGGGGGRRVVSLCTGWCGVVRALVESHTPDAYIAVAIFGDDHATSTRRARALISKHAAFTELTRRIASFYVRLAKFSCTFLPVLAALLLYDQYSANHFNQASPLIFIAVFCWQVSESVLNVFEVAKSAVVVCYCVDMEMNDGTDRPYKCPATLLDAMKEIRELDEVRLQQMKKIEGRLWGMLLWLRGNQPVPESPPSNFSYEERYGGLPEDLATNFHPVTDDDK